MDRSPNPLPQELTDALRRQLPGLLQALETVTRHLRAIQIALEATHENP